MSALARILLRRGHKVTGSDRRKNLIVHQLSESGVQIFDDQTANNINVICSLSPKLQPLVIISSAIPANNPELAEALKKKLNIWHRADLLGLLIKEQPSIAVAGTHGKTTTSTLITTLLAKAGEDPSSVIGGLVPHYNSNGHAGAGRMLIAEADESDGSLVKFEPEIGVITNLELDHIDYYSSLSEIIQVMKKFISNSQRTLINHDCNILRKNFKPSAWFSIKETKNIDFAAIPMSIDGCETIADIYEQGNLIGTMKIPIPGLHNLSNTIAAYGACRLAGISMKNIQDGLPFLKTPGRRFDFRGTWKERFIVDDYAHHPSEISATLKMARLMIESGKSPFPASPNRLLVVFQPHRYSRTKEFLNEYIKVLGNADLIFLAPIYSAGEEPIENINSTKIADLLEKKYPHININVGEDLNHLTTMLKTKSQKNDLIIAMGAGSINTLWDKLIKNEDNKSLDKILAA